MVAFLLLDANDPARCYSLGQTTQHGVQTVHIDPATGVPVFGSYCSTDEAHQQVGKLLGNCTTLVLRLLEPDRAVERFSEELVLEKLALKSERSF